VFIVAASGFFTDSYNLFASNVILPALSYVYGQDNEHGSALAFNLTTLIASVIGQVVFGYLADRYGRKALYGIELIIVIISTTGLLQSSNGFSDGQSQTWGIYPWILFWRAVMGLGIGAGEISSPYHQVQYLCLSYAQNTLSADASRPNGPPQNPEVE
jgi:PHS family inorganic phosphate transporter-like MFS transporter